MHVPQSEIERNSFDVTLDEVEQLDYRLCNYFTELIQLPCYASCIARLTSLCPSCIVSEICRVM